MPSVEVLIDGLPYEYDEQMMTVDALLIVERMELRMTPLERLCLIEAASGLLRTALGIMPIDKVLVEAYWSDADDAAKHITANMNRYLDKFRKEKTDAICVRPSDPDDDEARFIDELVSERRRYLTALVERQSSFVIR